MTFGRIQTVIETKLFIQAHAFIKTKSGKLTMHTKFKKSFAYKPKFEKEKCYEQ